MNSTESRTASGKVIWSFAMSVDGFVAGPNHEMDWMTGFRLRPGLIDDYIESTGAVLGGRDGWDATVGSSRPWGGAWHGPIFVLTHHPEDAIPADDVTFLNCDPAQAVRIGLQAACGKNLAVFSPTIGAQLLDLDLSTTSTGTSCRSCSAMASGFTTTPAATRSGCTGSAQTTPPWSSTSGTGPPHRSPEGPRAATETTR
jgi:dihydrofolate reductase